MGMLAELVAVKVALPKVHPFLGTAVTPKYSGSDWRKVVVHDNRCSS